MSRTDTPAPAAGPAATVIILNWNGADFLPACLAGLEAQTCQDFDILLVDQGCTDGSTRAALERFGPSFGSRLEVIRSGRNLGFTGGNNLAFARARGRWLALLNMDAVPSPGWIEALVGAADGDPSVGMAASRVLLAESPDRLDNTGHGLYRDGLNCPRGRGEPDGARWRVPAEVLCPSGCAGLYRRDAVKEVGGFEPRFFAYGDDLDLGLSIRALGLGCVYVPGAEVRHHLSASSGRASAWKAYYVERNRLWVAVKHFPAGALVWVPPYTLARYLATALALSGGAGPAAVAARDGGPFALMRIVAAMVRAYGSAAAGLPEMIRARRRLGAIRRVAPDELSRWLERFPAGLREVGWLELGTP